MSQAIGDDPSREGQAKPPAGLPGLTVFTPEELDEGDDDVAADLPRTVLITGAAGNIGRKLRAAWEGRYEIIPVDRKAPDDDPDVIAADLADWDEEWVALLDEADTVIHLAANPDESAAWEDLHRPNLDATFNVFLAAAQAGVERLVFASSNHAMGDYRPLDGPITVDLPPKPDGPYGGTKLMGERLGRTLAAAYGITFVGLRIGWVRPGANRPEEMPDDWNKSIWLSNGDLVRLVTAAVEAELEPGTALVVNGVSRNRGTRWSLAEAERIGYHPEDDAHG